VKIYRLRGKGQWPATKAGGLARHRTIIFGHDRHAHSTLAYYTVADNIFRPFDDLLQTIYLHIIIITAALCARPVDRAMLYGGGRTR